MSLKNIILSRILDKSTTGYRLTKELEGLRGASHQQVYREIKKLKGEGALVSRRERYSDKPDAFFVAGTPEGKDQFESWIDGDIKLSKRRHIDEVYDKLIAVDSLDDHDTTIEILDKFIVKTDELISDLTEEYNESRKGRARAGKTIPDSLLLRQKMLAVQDRQWAKAMRQECEKSKRAADL